MSSIGFVVDTGSNIPPSLRGSPHIYFVNLHVIFGQQVYNTADMSIQDFDAKAAEMWPTSSGPSIGEYLEAFQKALGYGYDRIMCFPISSGVSASYSAAVQARLMLEPADQDKVTVVDVKTGLFAIGFLIEEIFDLWNAKKSWKKIVQVAEDYHKRVKMFLIFDTLEYLRRGGRISYIKNLFGSLLGLKPILCMNLEGKLVEFAKARTFNMALNRVIEELQSLHGKTRSVGILHTGNLNAAISFSEKIADALGLKLGQIPMEQYGLPYYVHAGPGALGVCVIT